MCGAETLGALLAGARLEPLLHPKPGAVTRIWSHGDKNIVDFILATIPLEIAAYTSCIRAARRCYGSIAEGFRAYRVAHRRLGLKRVNTNLGTLLLLLPLAAAHGLTGEAKPEVLTRLASEVALECGGVDETVEYYRILRMLSPGHLGSYRGPVESVWDEPSTPFPELLRAVSWDHVHREILEGYPITMDMADTIKSRDGDLEEAALYAMLATLSRHGDTLVARRWGWRACKVLMSEARWALRLSAKWGVREVLDILDASWRSRGWNPGSVLDMLAVALGLYMLGKLRG